MQWPSGVYRVELSDDNCPPPLPTHTSPHTHTHTHTHTRTHLPAHTHPHTHSYAHTVTHAHTHTHTHTHARTHTSVSCSANCLHNQTNHQRVNDRFRIVVAPNNHIPSIRLTRMAATRSRRPARHVASRARALSWGALEHPALSVLVDLRGL